jgi:hypothetical protein
MKTTLEIDDILYREVKAMSALTGRKMKDLVSEGLRHVLHPPAPENASASGKEDSGLAELREWFKATDRAMKKAPKGQTVRDLLEQDRGRLERP